MGTPTTARPLDIAVRKHLDLDHPDSTNTYAPDEDMDLVHSIYYPNCDDSFRYYTPVPAVAPETAATPLARAYLPAVTTRYARILNLDPKVNKDAPGSVKYVKDENPPAGATPTAWDLYTDEAVAAYRRASAIVVPA